MVRIPLSASVLVCVTLTSLPCVAADVASSSFSTRQRIPWTESRIHGTPDPPDPYRLEVAFPYLRFDSPIDLAAVPGGERLAVVEHRKGISTFRSDPTTRTSDVLLDLSSEGVELIAAAFHPEFPQNRRVFFTQIDSAGVHVMRMDCTLTKGVPIGDPATKKVVYSWPTGGHTGGCIRFGPDGLLYVGTGDGSGHSDTNQYAQDVGDPRGSILRLDVNHEDQGKLYRIPADNPFVGHTGALPEIFAYGLRQPWKFSFDGQGRLWAGDVGQDLWEMVHVIQKGGNYGWSLTEGSHPFRPERTQGPTSIIPPVVEHHHNEFRSVTGGHVYSGSRLPELSGAYLYGDFDTGRLWMLRYDDGLVREHRQLASSRIRVVGFGRDTAGEVYVLGYAGGRIHRLQKSAHQNEPRADFPRKLSQTGLFASTAQQTPAPGLIPYSINAPAYADGAVVERYLAIPDQAQIEWDSLLYPNGPGAPPGWRFPDGTVVVQTFSLPVGSSGAPRRLETRILHHQRMAGVDDEYGAQIWHGYSYIWNDDQTDAELADAAGLDFPVTIADAAIGRPREVTWHVPSRTQCAVCHNIASKHVIAVNTLQLNRQHDYGDEVENQLQLFDRLGLFTSPLPQPATALPRLTDYTDATASLDDRARSYLHANCAHCHRQWGGGNASFQLMATLSASEMGIVDAAPTHGTFGISDAKVVAPGDPYHSVLWYRMAGVGPARMPRLGAATNDPLGLRLIHDWIGGLSAGAATTAPPSSLELPASIRGAEASRAAIDTVDDWLADTARSLRLARGIDTSEISDPMRELILSRAVLHADAAVRDLFDRFLPEAQRVQRLGPNINVERILAMQGDPRRGELLFFESKTLQCQNCHQVHGRGTKLGPDLSQVAKQYDRYRLLDALVNPARDIKPEFQLFLVETIDGQVWTGLRMPDDGDTIVLKDAQNQERRFAAARIRQLVPQPQSMMPESLAQAMTAQQLADLLAYLNSLK